MLKIRLQRVGRKHEPKFRVVLTDSKNSPKSGKYLEVLGSYDSRLVHKKEEIKAERVKYWMSKGAQLSETLHNLFVDLKIIEGKKVNVLPRKSPIKKEGEAVAAAPGAGATAPAATPVGSAPTAAPEAPKA
jgi:small subunit ribosomal protein S16